jgi:hypothetical protein
MAIRARLVYPEARDATLDLAPWNFALARADLARTDYEAPAHRPHWTYEFLLPTGVGFHVPPYCLAVRGTTLDPDGPPWEVGTSPTYGRVLWSNQEAVHILYTARIEDLTTWSALGRQVLVKMLASKLAKTDKLADQKLKEAYGLLPVAQRRDRKEGSPMVLRPNRLLVSARQRTGSVSPYVGIRTYVP